MEDYGGRNQICVNIHKRQNALPPPAAAAAAAVAAATTTAATRTAAAAPTGARAVATTAAVVVPTARATATATGHRKEQHGARKSSSNYQKTRTFVTFSFSKIPYLNLVLVEMLVGPDDDLARFVRPLQVRRVYQRQALVRKSAK